MQRKIELMSLAAASLIAGTVGAFAQDYRVQPRFYGGYGAYGAFNGANHPTPSSTQGDVGPGGNNNGTLTFFPGYAPFGGYGPAPRQWYEAYGAYGPAPSSTQGDVGPMGNNNGTRTGYYRRW
jgi:hypothetical protein